MKLTTKKTYFERRTQNVQKVEDAINLLERQIKECIITEQYSSDAQCNNEKEIDLYTKLLSGAVIIWCETLIKALFYEHGAFEEEQINELLSKEKSLEQKWTLALTCAFYKAFSGLPYNYISPIPTKAMVTGLTTIAQSEKKKFLTLYDLIETRLSPAIKVRNKIQHGDWIFAFKEAEYNKDRTTGIRTLIQKPSFDRKSTIIVEEENLLTLRLKRNQFRLIYGLIKDLAVFKRYGQYRGGRSSTPFQSKFVTRYNQILSNQGLLENSDFSKYRTDLVSSKRRGEQWKGKQKPQKVFQNLKKIFLKTIKRLVNK